MCEEDGVWVPELDELLNNFDALRNDVAELKKSNSELKELIIELIQKKKLLITTNQMKSTFTPQT